MAHADQKVIKNKFDIGLEQLRAEEHMVSAVDVVFGSDPLKTIVFEVCDTPAPASILEAGCGQARLGLALSMKGHQVTAFDFSEEALHLAKEVRCRVEDSLGTHLDISYEVGTLARIPHKTGLFDLVFNNAAIQHFLTPEERQNAISEMVRVLKPGGKFVVFVPNRICPFRVLWELTGFPKGIEFIPFTPAELEKRMKKAGLTNVQVRGTDAASSLFLWPPKLHNYLYLGNLFKIAEIWVPDKLSRSVSVIFSSLICGIGEKPTEHEGSLESTKLPCTK